MAVVPPNGVELVAAVPCPNAPNAFPVAPKAGLLCWVPLPKSVAPLRVFDVLEPKPPVAAVVPNPLLGCDVVAVPNKEVAGLAPPKSGLDAPAVPKPDV